MTLFVENLNTYLSELKIKQTYLSKITGIDKNKLSRILTGSQPETGEDMDKISKALGKGMDYFLSEDFSVPELKAVSRNKISFYAGDPAVDQEHIADRLIRLMENIDEVLSAESRFEQIARF